MNFQLSCMLEIDSKKVQKQIECLLSPSTFITAKLHDTEKAPLCIKDFQRRRTYVVLRYRIQNLGSNTNCSSIGGR